MFLLLFLGPPMLLALAIFLLVVPLPPPFPERLGKTRNLIAAIGAGIFGLLWLVALGVSVVAAFRKAGRAFESAMVALGLTAQSHMGVGRRYRGVIGGHAVDAEFVPARMLQWPLLGITVTANVGAEMFVGAQAPPLGGVGRQRVQIEGDALGELQVFAGDGDAARRLLCSVNPQIFADLLGEQRQEGLRELHVRPDRIYLRCHPTGQVSDERVSQWVGHLLALADAWAAPAIS